MKSNEWIVLDVLDVLDSLPSLKIAARFGLKELGMGELLPFLYCVVWHGAPDIRFKSV